MGFFDSILGFLGGVGGTIETVVSYFFSLISQVFQFVWNALIVVANAMLAVFKDIAHFFGHIWDGFFKKIFVSTFNALRSLGTWIETHLRPIIEWLQRAQKYILKLYMKYVKPVVVAIQRVRQVLTILRALHVQWAKDLDAALAKVQSDINGVFLKVTGTLNAVIDVLNIVTDPARLLRHPTLVLSVRRSINALIRQVTGLPPGFFFPSRSASAGVGVGKLPRDFDPGDQSQNPPPSYYMSLPTQVPSLGGWASGEVVPDDYGDDVPALDYFSSDVPAFNGCDDGVLCFLQAVDDARVRA